MIVGVLGLLFAGLNIHHTGRLIEGVVLCALMVVAAARTARSSVIWDQQGVVGKWTGATRRLVWSDIGGFEHRETGGLGARLRDGRWVRLMPYPRTQSNKPEQAIGALEAGRPTEL